MTSIATTVSNLLGTVDTTARSATSLITAMGRGASMLDAYVSDMQYRQHTDQVIMRDEYSSIAVMNAALKLSEMEHAIQTKLDAAPDLRTKYAEIYARLQAKVPAA